MAGLDATGFGQWRISPLRARPGCRFPQADGVARGCLLGCLGGATQAPFAAAALAPCAALMHCARVSPSQRRFRFPSQARAFACVGGSSCSLRAVLPTSMCRRAGVASGTLGAGVFSPLQCVGPPRLLTSRHDAALPYAAPLA
eukprot:15456395-Alexandrium_andersonii.AAC.1